jgi:sulfotransferase family protein
LVSVDLSSNSPGSVYVAGEGRSGTTWLCKTINYDDHYRYIHEPLHPSFPLAENFRSFQYLRPDDSDEQFLRPAQRAVTGAYHSQRVDCLDEGGATTRCLVKDVFSNLFLKWLHVRFPEMPLILVVRHPCAVAVSKIKLKEWIWRVNPADFFDQPELMNDHVEPFRGLIEETTDEFGKHILHWCLAHYVPLRQFSPGEICIVAYEHVCIRREQEICRLLHFLGRESNPKAIAASFKPSPTVAEDSAVVQNADLVSGWKDMISPSQRRRACEIMDPFGLRLYSDDPLPLLDNLDACLSLSVD